MRGGSGFMVFPVLSAPYRLFSSPPYSCLLRSLSDCLHPLYLPALYIHSLSSRLLHPSPLPVFFNLSSSCPIHTLSVCLHPSPLPVLSSPCLTIFFLSPLFLSSSPSPLPVFFTPYLSAFIPLLFLSSLLFV